MKERPIIFKHEMVRAILSGTKTQTRRVVKTAPAGNFRYDGLDLVRGAGHWFEALDSNSRPTERYESVAKCPYGEVGDRLWVRESFFIGEHLGDGWVDGMEQGDLSLHYFDGVVSWDVPSSYAVPRGVKEEHNDTGTETHWRRFGTIPSIFMPRWASRITLEITSVRIERLNDISHADSISEGVSGDAPFRNNPMSIAQACYAELWESINGKGSWDANPWVWVVDFERAYL